MKKKLLAIWQCPNCKNSESNISITQEDLEIISGKVKCTKCNREFCISNGILKTNPHLSSGMKDEISSMRKKTSPKEGKVFPLAEKVKLDNEWLLSLPVPNYHAGQWNPRHDLDYIIKKLNITRNHKILDLGAGVCWTTHELAKHSDSCISVDIINDKYLGLESAEVYIKSNGRYFERVNATMENLPFKKNVFDFIITNCSAHHAEKLDLLFQEIKRVLKPDGFYILSNELTQGVFKKSTLEGNDHFYTINDYLNELKKAGFIPNLNFPASIHNSFLAGSFQRNNGRWKMLGALSSNIYKNVYFQKIIKRQTYLASLLFGLPPIIISTIKES